MFESKNSRKPASGSADGGNCAVKEENQMQRVKLKKDAVTWLYLNEEKISLKKLSGSELAEHFAGAVELLIDRKSREILAAGPSQEAIEKELPSHPEISKRKTAFYPGPVQSDISPAA